jgi:hypothetical protein
VGEIGSAMAGVDRLDSGFAESFAEASPCIGLLVSGRSRDGGAVEGGNAARRMHE